MSNYKYKFSVVIPIYNVEKYLEETIKSVIGQTIGFKENIQMILVNDGSADKSEEICLRYKDEYPENIIYVKQKNAGVSAARNNGMEYIEGEYVNFLDSDDKWKKDAFEKVYKFYKNNDNIDVVVGRMKLFEALDEFHILDYKFVSNKIVDILKDYSYIHLHITSSFIKSETAKKFKFNVNQRYGEDTTYINEVIFEKCKYGIVADALHYYRRRLDASSAIQNKEKNIEWYTTTLDNYYGYLMNLSINKYGKVIPYIQYLIAYDMQFRIKSKTRFVKGLDVNKYSEDLSKILKNIDDKIIYEQKNIYQEHKKYLLQLKYQKDISDELVYKDGDLYFNDIRLLKIKKNKTIIRVDYTELKNKILKISGRVIYSLKKDYYNIYLSINGSKKLTKLELKEIPNDLYYNNILTKEKPCTYQYTYSLNIPLDNVEKINFIFKFKDETEDVLKIKFTKFSKLSNIKSAYYKSEENIIKILKDKTIKVLNNTRKNRIKCELRYIQSLLKERKISAVFYRTLYYIFKKFNKKQIWLISDRKNKANDNGEHIFKYALENKNNNIKPYFVISSKSEDYKKMQKIGKVIKFGGLKFKVYFLMASKIISSQANDYVINAFEDDELYYRDLYNFDFVFLQHGITQGDLSRWLKKSNKNIGIFVTAARAEYDSIINGKYGYTENEVKLTGFPRHDALLKGDIEKEKKVVIIPTWRKKIKGSYIDETGESKYLDTFKNTEYFKFYNNLINDKRLLEVLKETGYKCKFCLHPSHYKQYVDFKGNDYVEINQGFVDYQKEFKESALLVTDYSSVAFDFAYLRKPIVYSQFDKESFFDGNHICDQGYFEYDRDGFGPACYDYETTLQAIINYIKKDCKIEDKYLERINNFYAYHDTNNCKRVYDEILKLK